MITIDHLLKEDQCNNIPKDHIEIIDHRAILLYPSVLNKKIKIEGYEIPQLISMIPGNTSHYIESIEASKIAIDELLEKMFLPYNEIGQSNKKSFFIKKLICQDNLIGDNRSREFQTIFSMASNNDALICSNVFIQVFSLLNKGFIIKILLTIDDGKTIVYKTSNNRMYPSFAIAKQACLAHYWRRSYEGYGNDLYEMIQSPYVGLMNHYLEDEKSFSKALQDTNMSSPRFEVSDPITINMPNIRDRSESDERADNSPSLVEIPSWFAKNKTDNKQESNFFRPF